MTVQHLYLVLIFLIGSFLMCVVMRLIVNSFKENEELNHNNTKSIDIKLNKYIKLVDKLNKDIDTYENRCLELEKVINKNDSNEELINHLIYNTKRADDFVKKIDNKLIIAILLEGNIYNRILDIYNLLDRSTLNSDETYDIMENLNNSTKQLISYLRQYNFNEKDIINLMKIIANKFNNRKNFSISLYVPDYRANIYANSYLETKKNSTIVKKILSVGILNNKRCYYRAEVE